MIQDGVFESTASHDSVLQSPRSFVLLNDPADLNINWLQGHGHIQNLNKLNHHKDERRIRRKLIKDLRAKRYQCKDALHQLLRQQMFNNPSEWVQFEILFEIC